MKKIIAGVVLITSLLSPFVGISAIPIAQATTLPALQDCGTLNADNIPLIDKTKVPTAQDIAANNCMNNAILNCTPATVGTYSNDSPQLYPMKILGPSGSQCQLYYGFNSTAPPSQLCKLNLSDITAYNTTLQNSTTSGDKDLLFMTLFLAAALSSTPTGSSTGTSQITCQSVSEDLTPLNISLFSANPTSAKSGSQIQLYGHGFLSQINLNYTNLSSGLSGTIPNISTTSNGDSASLQLPTLAAGDYFFTATNANGISNPLKFTITDDGTVPPITTSDAHPWGTNVKFPDGSVYRVEAGGLASYADANTFLSYKFNKWADVVPASQGDMNMSVVTNMPPRDGSLISDHGTIYIISEGKARQPFGSSAVFKGYGYSSKYVYPANTSGLVMYPTMTSYKRIHPDGTLIKNKGAYFIMNSHQRLAVPSVEVLDSWGYWLDDAVQANSYDLQTPIGAVLGLRPFNQYRY